MFFVVKKVKYLYLKMIISKIMKTSSKILGVIVLIVVALLIFTTVSPILILAEDTTEGTPGVDMAASFSPLAGGFSWVYPGSSYNANGETLHNIHLIDPDNPYGAAREIISYTYSYTPHLIVSVNEQAAEAIFGLGLVDNIRANDAYNGYGGSNVQGTMSRGDAVSTAMAGGTFNPFEIPVQLLMGNIKFYVV